ncbi:hypothetical protein [Paractinoplanes maris]|uniref:hypothetical protein n=1 Tax=Paractinoplanes maris TaxID=1734446 RepID=UPI002021D613|nr:hypothetical protein [Actinoplanes maris]
MNLRPAHRKFWLVLHILSASAWIGVDVMVAVLVGAGELGGSSRGLAYQALGSFVVWPMLVSGLVCLVTGLVLGLGTKWGLVRYWWVAVKLVLNVVLCTLILVLLRPGMPAIRAYGERLSAGESVSFDVSRLIMPPIVSLTLLSLATVLSVYKPWGRVRRRTSSRRAEPVGRGVEPAGRGVEPVGRRGESVGRRGESVGRGVASVGRREESAARLADEASGQRARQATAKRAARTP